MRNRRLASYHLSAKSFDLQQHTSSILKILTISSVSSGSLGLCAARAGAKLAGRKNILN